MDNTADMTKEITLALLPQIADVVAFGPRIPGLPDDCLRPVRLEDVEDVAAAVTHTLMQCEVLREAIERRVAAAIRRAILGG